MRSLIQTITATTIRRRKTVTVKLAVSNVYGRKLADFLVKHSNFICERTNRYKCLAFTECVCRLWWKCAIPQFRTMGMHKANGYSTTRYTQYSILSRATQMHVHFHVDWRRWIKCDMRKTSKPNKTNKTNPRKHHDITSSHTLLKLHQEAM